MAFINFALNSRTLLPSDYILDCMLYCMLYAFFSSLWSSPYIPWQLLNFFWERVFGAGGSFVELAITEQKREQQEHLRDVRETLHKNIRGNHFPNRHKLPTKSTKLFPIYRALFLTTHPRWLRVPPVMLHREGLRWCDFYSVPWR